MHACGPAEPAEPSTTDNCLLNFELHSVFTLQKKKEEKKEKKEKKKDKKDKSSSDSD